MRPLMTGVLLLVAGTCAFAQQSRYNGYGNVVFPGTGGPPPIGGPRHPVVDNHPPRGPRGGPVAPPIFPIYYPVPLFWDSSYQQPVPPPPPTITIVMPQPTPPVVINQNFVPETAKPVMTEYGPNGQPAASSPANDSPVFLIALKDSSVYSAVAYWVEGETLHYVTPQGKLNEVSLQLVDRSVSSKLNANNKLDLHLPAER